MKNSKICVVGGGDWGKNHIKTLYNLGALGGVVDKDSSILNNLSTEFPNIQTYNNLNDALDNDEFSGFTVATPASTHYNVASKIISRNKNVLIEKPLCLNLNDSENLINLSNKHNVNLLVGHVMLFHPAINKIKKLIDSGKIGRLKYIYSNRLNFGKVRDEENVFWSLAPHDISIFQYLIGHEPNFINSQGSTLLQEGIHDSSITHLKYPNEIEGHIFVSWIHPFKEHRIVVIGTEGMLVFDDNLENASLKLYSKKFNIINGKITKIDAPYKLIEFENKMPLTEELSYFIGHQNNKRPSIANGQHALEVMKILIKASNQLEKIFENK